jgi:hypothetical protein
LKETPTSQPGFSFYCLAILLEKPKSSAAFALQSLKIYQKVGIRAFNHPIIMAQAQRLVY